MNTYLAIHDGRRIEILAETLYEAKLKAIAQLKLRKKQEGLLSVMLAKRADGSSVIHSTDSIG